MKREGLAATGAFMAVAVGVGYLLATPDTGNLQLLVSVLLLITYLFGTLLRPALGVGIISATLPFLGMLRRMIAQQSTVSLDYILLIVPVYSLIMMLVIVVTYRERVREIARQSVTSRLLLILMGIMVLQILNPLQGGIFVGAAGAIFYLVPLCWFFIGRIFLGEQAMKMVLVIFTVTTIIAGAYGLMQTLIGFPDWDQNWIIHATRDGYNALHTAGTVRAFGPSASPAEYASLLAAGLACLLALLIFRLQPLALVPGALLAAALLLASVRTAVVLVLVTLIMLLMLRQKSKSLAVGVIIVVCAAGLFAFQSASGSVYSSGSASAASLASSSPIDGLIAHQINGLTHPFTSKYSTGGSHLSLVLSGFAMSLRNPVGYGLGSTTLAAWKFSGDVANELSTEYDIPNVFIAGGVIAGILYVIILYRTFRAGFTIVFRYKRTVDVLCLAAITVSLGAILNGEHYSLMPMLWMAIAWLDRCATDVLMPERVARLQWRRLRAPLLQLAPQVLSRVQRGD